MQKIETKAAPKAIGPYSQAIIADVTKMLFISGQVPIDPATGQLVPGGIEEQTTQVFNNIEGILSEAGLSLKNVVRMEVFMTNLDDFQKMNGIYSARFKDLVAPARFTVQVSRLPAGAQVEIAAIACYQP